MASLCESLLFAERMLLQTALFLHLLQVGVGAESVDNDSYYCYGDGHLHTGSPCRFFAIVIDAGSTGTRIQIYRFVHSTNSRGLQFHAEEEIFHEVMPGLSSYHDRPREAAKSVEALIEKAKFIVPAQLRGKTPITVKATAGLRLLSGDAAKRILEEVESSVKSSEFACLLNCVGILDGNEEGVLSWFTLNLLLQRFSHDSTGNEVDPSPGRSAAAFDLGGGSFQVTYWPRSESLFDSQPEFRHDINFFKTHMHLYTHSYLGAGLQTARLSILRGEKEEKEEILLKSACFPPEFHLDKWEHARKEWRVSGTDNYSFSGCQESVRSFVQHASIAKLAELRSSDQLYFFSYFFDRATQSGIVREGESQRSITVAEWRRAAEQACARSAADLSAVGTPHWRPWQCLDLTYIHALLTEGFGFDEDQNMIPIFDINGMRVSWALGMAYSLVDEYHQELALEDVDDDNDEDVQRRAEVSAAAPSNGTGVEIVDSLLAVISQKTTDVLQFLNLVS